MKATLLHIVPSQNILGEGVLWDERTGAVWWTDIQGRTQHCYSPDSDTYRVYDLPERLGAFGFTAVDGLLVAAFESGFAYYRPLTGDIHWIDRPFTGTGGLRFNDGRVDAKGRFWCGTMAEDGKDDTIEKGALYCLDEKLETSRHISDIHIANSLCWSPDGTHMYFADSPRQKILRYDFDMKAGQCAAPHLFAETSGDTVPDGSVTDSAGYLWNAQWGGSRVVRYGPDGHINSVLDLPVSQPTCVAFGGPDMNRLFITTAREGLSKENLAEQPDAGNLFIYQLDVKGLPAPLFKGPLP